jgi:lysyl-tRNA synthetase class 2
VEDTQPTDGAHGLAAEKALRLNKLAALRDHGVNPYPYRFDRTHAAEDLHAAHDGLAPGTETEERVAVAGRLMLIRRQGRLTFATMRDRTGDLQLFVSRAVVGDEAHDAFDRLDLGDWVGAEGTVMTTKRGELSVKVDRFELLAKAIRPLPDKWKGLSDTDTRYRQRYVDLIVNEEARRVFEIRRAVIASFRTTLAALGFVEVETPILHVEAGGAHARPFVTHHNSTCTCASRWSCTSSG